MSITRPQRRPRASAPDDDGAALIIALAFVAGVGLIVGALLSYGSANIRAAAALRERAQVDYDVDGALQTAVNTIRTNGYDNAPGQQCFSGSGTFAYTGGTAVVCTPQPGTGAAGGQAQVDERNRPAHALLAVGKYGWFSPDDNDGEPGIGQLGNHTLRVRGNVHTNAGIALLNGCINWLPWVPCGRLQQDDPESTVSATSTCLIATIISPGGQDCDADEVEDPGKAGEPRADSYAQPRIPDDATVFTNANTPTCSSGTASTVRLQPGVYTDSKPLNDLTNCTQKVIHFTPGVYFLDFRNGERGQPAVGGTDAKVWRVNNPNATIVGGTPQGWSPNAATKPALTVPGSCVSPVTSPAAGTGVQFVLGGDSRIELRSGSMELCGQWRADRPPIAIYGAKADQGVTSGTGKHTGATSTTTPAFTNLPRLGPDDGDQFATAAFNNAALSTARVKASGFSPATAPPVGSTLHSATLTVRERVRAGGRSLSGWKFTVSWPTGSEKKDVSLSTTANTSWRTSSTDLLGTDLEPKLASAVANGTFTSLDVTFEASTFLSTTANADVEAVSLELGWIPPRGIRGQKTKIDGKNNCVGTPFYGPVFDIRCAMLKTSGSAVRLNVAGTAYAPQAAVDVGLSGTSRANFRWGVVVRSFRTDFDGWTQADESMIELPDNATGPADLVVHLSAYTCAATPAACAASPPPSAAWRAAGQAKVTYAGAASARKVDVDAWRVMR
jgi:hypothetical protein